ncbi:MAG: hypothetical protein ACRD15_04215 [Vicinamibacterales bacterium]
MRAVGQRHVEGYDGIELHAVGNTGVEGGQNGSCFDQVIVTAAEPHHLRVLVFGRHRGDASPDYSQQRQPVLVDQSHLIEVVEGRILGALECERLHLLDPFHAVWTDVAQEPVNVLVELVLCYEDWELIGPVGRLRARVRDDELMYQVVQAGPKVVQNVANDEAMAYGRRLDLGCNKLLTARFGIADNL